MLSTVGAILAFLISFQLLFVGVYLLAFQKGNRGNNVLLGAIFLMFSISLADFTVRVIGFVSTIPMLHLIDDGFFFLYGPLLFLYTKSVAFRDFKIQKKYLIHFIPYLIVLLVMALQFGFTDPQSQEEMTKKVITASLPAWVFLVSILIYVHILLYLWGSWQSIKKYRRLIKHQFSSIDQINLDWLAFLIRAFTTITIIAMVHNLMPVIEVNDIYYTSILLLLFVSFLFINGVLVKALNRPEIFSGVVEVEKYATSTLKTEEINQYKSALIELMEVEKAYLNPELTSKELAEQINTSPKVLSQVINQRFNQNFFDFVNSYRCEEVKKILGKKDEKFTIIEAMYQSGFNSKSSFNKEFKKLTGQSPSEYRRSLKI